MWSINWIDGSKVLTIGTDPLAFSLTILELSFISITISKGVEYHHSDSRDE